MIVELDDDEVSNVSDLIDYVLSNDISYWDADTLQTVYDKLTKLEDEVA